MDFCPVNHIRPSPFYVRPDVRKPVKNRRESVNNKQNYSLNNVRKSIGNSHNNSLDCIPHAFENLFYSVPRFFPVALENAREKIDNSIYYFYNSGYHIG